MKGEDENMCYQAMPCNLEEELKRDRFYYMPEELWPEDATDIDRRPCHLWYRYSEWQPVKAVNESNKALLDKCVEHYKKHFPDVENPIELDDFWLKCVDDAIIGNAIANRDYVFDGDNCGRLKIRELLKQYDVVIQETLGGYICRPFLVYDIEYRNHYGADVKFDDYAKAKFDELVDEFNTKMLYGTERNLIMEKRDLEIQMIKEGHATFTVSLYGKEFRLKSVYVDHDGNKPVLHRGVVD